MSVIIETSARHVHLCQEHLDILFGFGYSLTPRKELSQPGQVACAEQVKVIGPRGAMSMSVIGPVRPVSQVELSITDARSLGVKAPIRVSGDLRGSGSCMLVGPCGEVELREGVIIARRHLHVTPEDAAELGLRPDQTVRIAVNGESRALVFGDVAVRISPDCATRFHIDTDEANAAGLFADGEGEILP